MYFFRKKTLMFSIYLVLSSWFRLKVFRLLSLLAPDLNRRKAERGVNMAVLSGWVSNEKLHVEKWRFGDRD